MPVDARGLLSVGLKSLCVLAGGFRCRVCVGVCECSGETPTAVVVEGLTETSAIFRGELEPGTAFSRGPDSYEFLYRKSSTECEGESRAPEPPGTIKLGKGKEALPPLEVSGLEAHTVYTVCLLARNEAGEAVGPVVTFTTPPVPPTIASESAEEVEATAVTLRTRAIMHRVTWKRRIASNTGPAKLHGQNTPESASIGSDDTVSCRYRRGSKGLQSGTTYHYRASWLSIR